MGDAAQDPFHAVL